MEWNIVADSSCDLFELEEKQEGITYASVPFTIQVEDKEYIDDEQMNTQDLVEASERSAKASLTACPSSYAWYEKFEQQGNVIAVTISSELSGSYNSACAAREMILENDPDRKIAIIDSRSTGPEMILIIRKLCSLIRKGHDFETVIREIENYRDHVQIIFALSSFNNLIKNGRMNKLIGLIAGKLNFWGLGIASKEGRIQIKQKLRGCKKVVSAIIEDMKEREILEYSVIICHCHNAKLAEELKAAIEANFNAIEVKIFPTRGLCSFYAENGGMLVSY